MRSYVEMNDSTSVVRKEDQNMKQVEGDGGDNKKVNRDDLCGVVLQECFPSLFAGLRGLLRHVAQHGGL